MFLAVRGTDIICMIMDLCPAAFRLLHCARVCIRVGVCVLGNKEVSDGLRAPKPLCD